jgi:hypothetical protein
MESAVKSFDTIAYQLSTLLRKRGIEKAALSHNRPLEKSPLEKQKQALERASQQLHQMEIISGHLEEYEKLRILCHYHKVQPADPTIFDRLTQNTAWEIIDFNLNQLYRNEVVFKLGNYSIEDYESFSPWELFSRPQSILAKLAENTMALKEGKSLVEMENLPPYVIEETKTSEKAQFRIKHFFACPLISKTSKESSMFISAFQVEALDPRNRVSILQ